MSAGGESASVFVTGGTGVVGRAVVRRLVANGRRVVALSRSEASRRTLAGMGADPVAGDILDRAALAPALRNCDVVYHVAGATGSCLRDPSQLFAVNVDGTGHVLEAAADAGVQRLVHTSSAATVGERRGEVGREDSTHRGWFLSDYERSKFEAERLVLDRGKALGVDVVCVNPASVQGPGRGEGTGRLLVAYLTGRLRWYVPTRFSLVDVDDCAAGHVLAEARGAAGQRYILSGGSLELDDALRLLGQITEVRTKPRPLPRAAVTAAGVVVETTARLVRRQPPLCREVARALLHGHHYDGSRAESELGLRYTPVEDTLRRTIAWLIDQGLAPATALAAR